MSGNSFGTLFKVTTWGESHGKALGAVIDGCPPGILLNEKDIQQEVDRRKPSSFMGTSRKEQDSVEILSGIFKERTTGMPISIICRNKNAKPKDYKMLENVFRPGHADYSFEKKYGIRDFRGGGRSSGRETIARVMAGAIAKKILIKNAKTKIIGHTIQVGEIKADRFEEKEINKNDIKCADSISAKKMLEHIKAVKEENDSVGGIIEIRIISPPAGLGEPVFNKLDADIAKALMSIGGVKGVSVGAGFEVAEKKGSENNDEFTIKNGEIRTKSNNAGGILGGISYGEDIIIRLAVKAPASIAKKQHTVDKKKRPATIEIEGRHDACIIPRLIIVAESMVAITLVDHLLIQKALS